MEPNYSPDWLPLYGDVDLTYGYTWVKDYGDYAEVLELVDLDSNERFDGAVALEQHSVGFYSSSLRQNVKCLRNALDGVEYKTIKGMESRTLQRATIWAEMVGHGYGDLDETYVVGLSLDPGVVPDGYNGSKLDTRVSGKRGLIRLLRQRYGLSFNRKGEPIKASLKGKNRGVVITFDKERYQWK